MFYILSLFHILMNIIIVCFKYWVNWDLLYGVIPLFVSSYPMLLPVSRVLICFTICQHISVHSITPPAIHTRLPFFSSSSHLSLGLSTLLLPWTEPQYTLWHFTTAHVQSIILCAMFAFVTLKTSRTL